MTTRREFACRAAALLAAASFDSRAQRPGSPKVALLVPASSVNEAAFLRGLRDLGYVDGGNVTIERRSADGDFARLPALAAEIVRLDPNVVVSFVTQSTIAMKQATSTLPIVMVAVADPVSSGIVTNLARPEGNITGTAGQSSMVIGKQLDLLRELRPGARHVAVLWNPANAVFQQQSVTEAREAAARLKLRASLVEVRSAAELDAAFASMAADRPDGVLVLADPLFAANARQIRRLVLQHRLVATGGTRVYAEAGVVATYGPDLAHSSRRAANYVDRILRGAKPGDLPIELAEKFELVINLNAAKALAVTVPQSLLLRADEVIQ